MNPDNTVLRYVGVVFNLPIGTVFTYEIPDPLLGARFDAGTRVKVPFGNRLETGFVVERYPNPPNAGFHIRPIASIVDRSPVFTSQLVSLARWMSEFYCSSFGEVLSAMAPPTMKRGETPRFTVVLSCELTPQDLELLRTRAPKQFEVVNFLHDRGSVAHADILRHCGCTLDTLRALAKKQVIALDSPDFEHTLWQTGHEGTAPHHMSPFQLSAVEQITKAVRSGKYSTSLLHGVTGSGKTEVYMRVLSEVINLGGKAIVLVPEISLTPQTIARFQARFPRLAVLHSAMSAGLRRRQWDLALNGKVDVVIGARSAVFAPFENLRLIVVDEEHEPSYKQENTPRYHAREVAIMRAVASNAVVVLGSATPSLESYHNAASKRYDYIQLPERVGTCIMPAVEIVDMNAERRDQKRNVTISRLLLKRMEATFSAGKQALLFLNRRGFNTFARCPFCGAVLKCPNCDITLTYHKASEVMICHYCDYRAQVDKKCASCNELGMNFLGSGTERIEEVLARLFPNARVARMDADTMSRRNAHGKLLGAFRRGEFDILLGTQMVAKGLDYPNITTVGVLDADVSLIMPDFRASERTFQLLAQVAGRTGRGESAGSVVIQTCLPNSFSVRCAASHDYKSFAEKELAARSRFLYPPYTRILRLIVRGTNKTVTGDFIKSIRELVANEAKNQQVEILGPVPPPIVRLEGKYRFHMIFKARSPGRLVNIANLIRLHAKPPSSVAMVFDMGPASLM